jgi:hypothetical protein
MARIKYENTLNVLLYECYEWPTTAAECRRAGLQRGHRPLSFMARLT